MFESWVHPLLAFGYKNTIDLENIYLSNNVDDVEHLANILELFVVEALFYCIWANIFYFQTLKKANGKKN